VVEFILVSKSEETGTFSVGNESLTTADLNLLQNAAFAIRNTAKIIDMPCNEMHTDRFIEEAEEIGKKLGIVPTIIRDEELNAKGFGGIYSVGQASVHPPALVVLSHTPAGATETVAWVGKGIVYDTGGLSIKSKVSFLHV
jgi:probable aminopeptidase NPEPL1